MIRFLLRLYPAAWRERYGDELRSLVEDTGVGPGEMLDITRGAARERWRAFARDLAGGVTMTVGPAWRDPAGWALVGAAVMAPTVAFVVGSMLAYQLGVTAFIATMDSANAWLQTQPQVVDLALLGAPLVALLAAAVPLLKLDLSSSEGGQLTVAIRLKVVNLLIGTVAVLVGATLLWHIVAESVLSVGA